jgi:hypothetical protein
LISSGSFVLSRIQSDIFVFINNLGKKALDHGACVTLANYIILSFFLSYDTNQGFKNYVIVFLWEDFLSLE